MLNFFVNIAFKNTKNSGGVGLLLNMLPLGTIQQQRCVKHYIGRCTIDFRRTPNYALRERIHDADRIPIVILFIGRFAHRLLCRSWCKSVIARLG